ncbi:YgfZ/GcvT domain-containing protein [Allorhizocola rhizosphaerae]|uniref:CAF17-like 4Fe-4S cluster assembly/insertion protein YgfZ n=1 Tax=Allorhizocola rhizosphaerae TaxID=1872709 RepID=UPI000E3D2E85|nr:folate-binding protein YgfZ [Allorhizocola rhizosphaerae]
MITVGQLDPASPDAPVAAHYGDPMREQRLDQALVDRSHRGVLKLTGPERLTFLHNLTTQHLLSLEDGQATQALLLSPHGHIEHHLWITAFDDALWVDVEPGALAPVRDFLLKMRFFTKVEIEDASLKVYSTLGFERGDVLPVPPAKFATGVVPARPTSLYPVESLPGGGFKRGPDYLVFDETQLPDLPRAGLWAYEARRVAARVPRAGFDTDHRTLPSEVDLTGVAVHLEKGCYRGQETVARVHHLGRPPRALRLLHLDGITTDHLPAPGTPITVSQRAVGFVGTAVRHFEQGPIALGVLKRKISGDAPLIAGESTVAVESGDDDD